MSSLESLSDAIEQRMKRAGLDAAMTATTILAVANRILPQTCPAKTFRQGTLTVYCANGAEAYFFKQERDTYIEDINAALGQAKIERMIVRLDH